mgnify:CR=1 FL=1
MKKYNVQITEEKEKILVDVALHRRQFSKDPTVQFSNSELLEYLKEEGVNLEEYELTDQTKPFLTSYSTKGTEPALEGTWIFEKKSEKKMNKKTSRTYNKSKVKKTGD